MAAGPIARASSPPKTPESNPSARDVPAPAAANQFLDALFDVKLEFVVEIAVDLAAAKDVRETG